MISAILFYAGFALYAFAIFGVLFMEIGGIREHYKINKTLRGSGIKESIPACGLGVIFCFITLLGYILK